jgi:tetratricopeptide (TPR) repeat protein
MPRLTTLVALTDAGLKKRGLERAAQEAIELAHDYPEYPHPDQRQKRDLKKLGQFIQRVESLLGSDDRLFTAKLMVLGKLGRFAPAIRLARKAYRVEPNWINAIAVANVLRRSGDIDGAAKMFLTAAKHNRRDVAAFLDCGDLYVDAERWAEALKVYERALKRYPTQPWAKPSVLYCRYRMHGDARDLRKLRAIAHRPPDECGVADMLAQLLGETSPDEGRRRAQELLARCGKDHQ